jgi:hypothetical protein
MGAGEEVGRGESERVMEGDGDRKGDGHRNWVVGGGREMGWETQRERLG